MGVGKSLDEALALPRPARESWRCMLALDDGSGRLRKASFGVDTQATAGFDARFDLPRPPASPSGGASLAMVRPEWKLACGTALAADITAPLGGDPVAWTARITPQQAGEVTLSWTNQRWPDGLDFQLYAPQQNRLLVMSMRDQQQVVLETGSGPLDLVVRTPSMLSGVDDALPFAGYALSVHPNPFNPATTITFDLPRDGRVDVRVYSVRGELVAELGGSVLGAGQQAVTWRGLDRQGRQVPSGSYFARLSLDGRIVGDTARLSLVR